jgi:hypothetical protein
MLLAAACYGIAAQQSLELIYVLLPAGRWDVSKKVLSKGYSVIVGAALTEWMPGVPAPKWAELALAGLVAAAVSEATNAVIKSLVYEKEARKARAAQEFSSTGMLSLQAMGRK